jgi:EAL domain-containing protein (putative c-di-GMP-specific phosphodiesterase class I)
MAVDPFRFLGLAFAAADLLIEVDETGAIIFAAGAGQRLAKTDDAGLIGRPWLELFAVGDRCTAEALVAGLADGERRGLAEIGLSADAHGASRMASLSAFKLPQIAPRVSCALTLTAAAPTERESTGKLFDRAEFESAARSLIAASRNGGPALELGLIEFGGLDREKSRMSAEDAGALDRRVAGALRAEAYGDAAAELGEQRFAVLRRKGDAPEAVVKRLTRILGANLEPSAQSMSVDQAAPPARLMRALRFALEGFLADGAADQGMSLTDALNNSVKKAVEDAGTFSVIVEKRDFKLVYQPVVSLSDGQLHHYETLVRFNGDQSPFAMIRMAEELDIIEDLDRAIAVNVSGRTIVSTGYVEAMSRLGKAGDLAGKLIFEVTETAAISDLALAQRHIQALQTVGYQVCLDDFGSGAASFAYLQQLKVDVVKIDGSYVRELTSSGRDDAMIRHLVNLCRELKVETVAEMVETKSTDDILRRAGVDYAQGWLYGQPAMEPQPPLKVISPPAARRAGAKEQWG